jgi:hypothetical protein
MKRPLHGLGSKPALASLFALILVLAAMAFAQSAHAATEKKAAAATADIICQAVIEKVRPGETYSRVKSEECVEEGQTLVAPAADIPILTVYEHINYGGRGKVFYGDQGPCDASGYRISNLGSLGLNAGWWNRNVSSFRYGSGCYYQNAYDDVVLQGYCWHFQGNVPWVGASANDTISSFRVSSAWRICGWR